MSTDVIACPACATLNRVQTGRLSGSARPKCGRCSSPLFTGEPVLVDTIAAFDRHVVHGTLPVVVDFWAEWCGPCRAMAPRFAAIARELEPHVRFLSVDTEALPTLAGRLRVTSLPTIVLFDDGREIARQAGLVPTAALQAWILDHLDPARRRAS